MKDKRPAHRREFLRAVASLGALIVQRAWTEDLLPEPPRLMLANVYDAQVDVIDYWVSEKYDGVRAFWDGAALVTRAGHTIATPTWFCAKFPGLPLDGELWIGRGRFEDLLATVRDRRPDEALWHAVRYVVFDLPRQSGPFSHRLSRLRTLTEASRGSNLLLAPQWRVASHKELAAELQEIVAAGGEGLMLKRDSAPYHAARSDDLLKVKPYYDAEALVIAHIPGQGKHAGKLGALEVRSPSGIFFRIGTGFTDEQRAAPPAIGSWITYRYQGTTKNGTPRFASFLRVRN